MSVEIHWHTLTTGPSGEEIAESVRAFIHEKFQQITLPRFIRSVQVHSFAFGDIAPEIEIKDICDPLPEFYEDEDEDENLPSAGEDGQALPSSSRGFQSVSREGRSRPPSGHFPVATGMPRDDAGYNAMNSSSSPTYMRSAEPKPPIIGQDLPASPVFANLQTPGIPGGTSNLSYFHLPFAPGLSGTATPLAAVAGAQFTPGWYDGARSAALPIPTPVSEQSNTLTTPSAADPASRPHSQHRDGTEASIHQPKSTTFHTPHPPVNDHAQTRDVDPNDIQIVAHVKYAGDLKLSLTAEIHLDYPMPSFVGIPLQVNITGLRFDGIAVVAYTRKRAHVCFLSPEDAAAFTEDAPKTADGSHQGTASFGALLEEIKVESEIGERENGKQVLKNVGKVERFILEQVRRIFEDEFVYPSFWTFLV